MKPIEKEKCRFTHQSFTPESNFKRTTFMLCFHLLYLITFYIVLHHDKIIHECKKHLFSVGGIKSFKINNNGNIGKQNFPD